MKSAFIYWSEVGAENFLLSQNQSTTSMRTVLQNSPFPLQGKKPVEFGRLVSKLHSMERHTRMQRGYDSATLNPGHLFGKKTIMLL